MNTTTAICSATHPDDNAPCWYPDGHHGRDLTNDWDQHQDATGRQWADEPAEEAWEPNGGHTGPMCAYVAGMSSRCTCTTAAATTTPEA